MGWAFQIEIETVAWIFLLNFYPYKDITFSPAPSSRQGLGHVRAQLKAKICVTLLSHIHSSFMDGGKYRKHGGIMPVQLEEKRWGL